MQPDQTTNQALREFEEKMRTEGADGFAAGPHPWEEWGESDIQQLESPVWDSSALHGKSGKSSQPGTGDRILNGLAMLALGSLAVGIAGVYFDDKSSDEILHSGIRPLPIIRDTTSPAGSTQSYRELAQQSQPVAVELQVLGAPAAGTASVAEEPLAEATEQPVLAGIETTEPLAIPEQVTEPVVQDINTPAPLITETTAAIPAIEPAEIDQATEQAELPAVAVEAAAPRTEITDQPALAAETGTVEPLVNPAQVAEPDTDRPMPLQADITTATPALEPDASDQAPEQAEIPALTVAPATPSQATETETLVAGSTLDEVPAPIVPVDTINNDETDSEQPQLAQGVLADTIEEPEQAILPETQPAPEPVALAEPEIEPQTPVAVTESIPRKTGDWAINLASYKRESTANKMLDAFHNKGVEAEIFSVTINGKPMYRIRITGYESYKTAKSEIKYLEAQLDLESIWISKR